MPRKKVIIIKAFIFTESMLWIQINVLVILVRSRKLDRRNKRSKFIEFR